MKFQITMKDPDALNDQCEAAATTEIAAIGLAGKLTSEERDLLIETRTNSAAEFAGQWMEYGEYITVEFDTEAGTATVVKDS